MPRVSAASLRRLAAIERAYDEDEVRVGGVMQVPAIMSLDAWEALAVPMQQELVRSSHEDIDRREPPAPYRDPMPGALTPLVEGVHFHRPNPHGKQEAVPIKRPPLPPTVTR